MIAVVLRAGEREVRAEAPAGARLLDVCDDARAPIPFSCRGATCGTCLVDVLEGGGLLDPPEDAERQLLVALGATGARLTCQARLAVSAPGPGPVVLRSRRR